MRAGGIGVLVVDDDVHVAKINAHYVSQMPGFQVAGIAHSAPDAFAAVERGGVDLLLLDHHLPDESGLSLIWRLRRHGYDIDAIMVTADRGSDLVRDALRAGVLHYVVKPFTQEGLRAKLHAYAQLRSTLGTAELDQRRIDRMLNALRAPDPDSALPKGFSERTADRICRIVAQAQHQISAQEVSEQARVSRSTAQRYLKYLEETGKLRLTLRYGDSGRPEHMYSGM
ncbi:response regulator receiver and unknown domain protein [Actinobacteria bacterium OK074]|nr:response regulator receiver and unknown domain protein [Actinobacteria bacterium OK074]